MFNLVDEKWIPVLWNNGLVSNIGIKEALTRAGNIRQIAASNPMDRFAIMRFLLAVLYWCKRNPAENEATLTGESLPSEWFEKLDTEKECFNLLGDGKRFYQDYKHERKKKTANYLLQEIPTGTNKWHFHHSTDGVDGLCPNCCVMGLLRLPLFSTSAGRGYSPGINMKPPIYFMYEGNSLADTLKLSWRKELNLGMPLWANPNKSIPEKDDVPLLVGMTWSPRMIWLDMPERNQDICISCGRKDHLIRKCQYSGIGSAKTDDDSGRKWQDPHVFYVISEKEDVGSLHAKNALGSYDAASGQWSEIIKEALLAHMENIQNSNIYESMARNKSRIWVVSFSTIKNDNYIEAVEWHFSLPALKKQNDDKNNYFDIWENEAFNLVKKAQPYNPNKNEKQKMRRKNSELRPTIHAIRPHVEHVVSSRLDELLTGDADAWDKAAQEYRPMMEAIAGSLSPGFTTAALERRTQISRVVPDMREKKSTGKSREKKGGKKNE